MRLGLLGTTGHLHTYAPALTAFPDLRLVATATAGPEESREGFANAPGLTSETRFYDDARQMLAEARLDVVQVCCRPERIPDWTRACLEWGVPVMAEKPLAMDMPTLQELYDAAQASGVPLLPMHTQRGSAELAAVRNAVQAGAIGEPLVGFSQKTYKWGATRPDFYRRRDTFPGLMPFIGIHALDWLTWILGDVFTEVQGREGTAARPDFPACASQGAYLLTLENGGTVAVTLDYLRPATAPTHGDERVRIAGTRGVIETALIEHQVTLITADQEPKSLPLPAPPDVFTAFVRSIRSEGPLVMSLNDAFRITEIALKAQQAADTGRTISLRDSPFV